MDDSALIAKMDAARARWVDLPGGKRVQFRRPLETDMGGFVGGVTVEHVCAHVCGWEGFTEADLLGAGIGASDAVRFTPALWARVVRDRIAYVQPVASAIAQAIQEHLVAMEAVAKN